MNVIENENFFLKEKNKKLEKESAKLKEFIKQLQIVPTSYFAERTRILIINHKDQELLTNIIKEITDEG